MKLTFVIIIEPFSNWTS